MQELFDQQYQFWLAVTKDQQRARRAAEQDVQTARDRGLIAI